MKKVLKNWGWKMIVPIYAIFYLVCFKLLEEDHMRQIHILQMPIDQKIPFCEYFVIPYLLWFGFIFIVLIWFLFFNKNDQEYKFYILNMGIGMTIFLFISWVYPNGHLLRPEIFEHQNIFTEIVKRIYEIDTATNIFPSIHVYNSVVSCIAVLTCKKLQPHKCILIGTLILTFSIILSTIFLKQHTVIDVIAAILLNAFVFYILYRSVYKREWLLQKRYYEVDDS